ncbi:MAG: TIGR00725 family protein [Nitrospinota bacterium]
MRTLIAVVGGSAASSSVCRLAEEVGRLIAERGAVLLCGGLGGVMEAAARGARRAGGLTVGVLPGYDAAEANPHIEVALCSGMGYARNVILVASAEAVIALEGLHGTLSEMAHALQLGKVVVALGRSHNPPGVRVARTPEEAVTLALSPPPSGEGRGGVEGVC